MAHIVIIGGGFAGLWSAAGAALARGEEDLRITLIAPNEHLVLRPRLYEPEPEVAKVELRRILEPIGVEHPRASVSTIDTARRVVVAEARRSAMTAWCWRRAANSSSPGACPAPSGCSTSTPWTGPGAWPGTCVTGRATPSWSSAPGSSVWRPRPRWPPAAGWCWWTGRRWSETSSARARARIEAALNELGIERRLGTTVAEVGDGYAVLSDGTRVEADAVVWSVGMKASELTRQVSDELDHLGRVPVDQRLRALPEVFVAGDTAAAAFDSEHMVMQACQHATPLGKVAGYNAAADLLDLPLREFTPGPYVTCLDLGAAGGIFTRGWDRKVMASGADGAVIKKRINQAIHPPVDDAAKILAAADRVHIELPFFPRSEQHSTEDVAAA